MFYRWPAVDLHHHSPHYLYTLIVKTLFLCLIEFYHQIIDLTAACLARPYSYSAFFPLLPPPPPPTPPPPPPPFPRILPLGRPSTVVLCLRGMTRRKSAFSSIGAFSRRRLGVAPGFGMSDSLIGQFSHPFKLIYSSLPIGLTWTSPLPL